MRNMKTFPKASVVVGDIFWAGPYIIHQRITRCENLKSTNWTHVEYLTYKSYILYDLQHDLQPGFPPKELVLKLSWFELTPRVYSSSGFSIDLNLVTLRQQNVEKVPSLVCIQSTLKWISLHWSNVLTTRSYQSLVIPQSVGLISLPYYSENLTQGIKNKNHSLWHWNWARDSFSN